MRLKWLGCGTMQRSWAHLSQHRRYDGRESSLWNVITEQPLKPLRPGTTCGVASSASAGWPRQGTARRIPNSAHLEADLSRILDVRAGGDDNG